MPKLEKVLSKLFGSQINVDLVEEEALELAKIVGSQLATTYRIRKFKGAACKGISVLGLSLFEADARAITKQLNQRSNGTVRYLVDDKGSLKGIMEKSGKHYHIYAVDEFNTPVEEFDCDNIVNVGGIQMDYRQILKHTGEGVFYMLGLTDSPNYQKLLIDNDGITEGAQVRLVRDSLEGFLDYMQLVKGGLEGSFKGFLADGNLDTAHEHSLFPIMIPTVEGGVVPLYKSY